MELNDYERSQVSEIRRWKATGPAPRAAAPVSALHRTTRALGALVPTAAIGRALDFSSHAAVRLTDTNDLVRAAGVPSVAALRGLDLQRSDELAESVHRWAIGIAAVEGGLTGAAGLAGFVADLPALVTIALRTINKIGACYGFEIRSDADREFALLVLAASSTDTAEQRAACLARLHPDAAATHAPAADEVARRLGRNSLAKYIEREAGKRAIERLARQLGISLGKRKSAQVLPLVGAGVGATMNAIYVNDVAWTARRAFQERWLAANGRIDGPIGANGP